MFLVTKKGGEGNDERFYGRSAKEAWRKALEDPKCEERMGLREHEVRKRIEGLKHALDCSSYEFLAMKEQAAAQEAAKERQIASLEQAAKAAKAGGKAGGSGGKGGGAKADTGPKKATIKETKAKERAAREEDKAKDKAAKEEEVTPRPRHAPPRADAPPVRPLLVMSFAAHSVPCGCSWRGRTQGRIRGGGLRPPSESKCVGLHRSGGCAPSGGDFHVFLTSLPRLSSPGYIISPCAGWGSCFGML